MDSGAGWCEELLTELKWNKKKRIKAPFSSWTQGKDNKKCWMDIVLKELQACGRHGWQEAYWCLALLAAPAASKPTLKIFFWSESFKTDNFFDASRVLQLESSLQKETLHRSTFNDATASLREDIKYYFADFDRKGGTPPPPLYGLFFRQKRNYGFGGYHPPPLYGFFPENLSSKRAKIGVFCSKKKLILVQKIGYGFGGYPRPPSPLYG